MGSQQPHGAFPLCPHGFRPTPFDREPVCPLGCEVQYVRSPNLRARDRAMRATAAKSKRRSRPREGAE